MSWKHLLIVLGIVGAITGTTLSLTVPAFIRGIERMVDTSKETLNTVNNIDKKVVIIETRQQTIIHRLNARGLDGENLRRVPEDTRSEGNH